MSSLVLAFVPTQQASSLETTNTKSAPENTYIVLRNNKQIGTHRITFEKKLDHLHVTSETHLRVKFLSFTAYRYRYFSEESWPDGVLQSISTNINDNGKKTSSTAEISGNAYITRLGDKLETVGSPVFTTNHWNKKALSQGALFNTLTAKMNSIEVLHGTTQNEYAIRGDLDINTFYDNAGHWLGMRFTHTDGSQIEFRCADCKNTPKGYL